MFDEKVFDKIVAAGKRPPLPWGYRVPRETESRTGNRENPMTKSTALPWHHDIRPPVDSPSFEVQASETSLVPPVVTNVVLP